MPYTVDPKDPTQPANNKGATQGGEELRALKQLLKNRDYVSLMDPNFGLDPTADDTLDATTALTNAIAEAIAGGRNLFIPKRIGGTVYNITLPQVINYAAQKRFSILMESGAEFYWNPAAGHEAEYFLTFGATGQRNYMLELHNFKLTLRNNTAKGVHLINPVNCRFPGLFYVGGYFAPGYNQAVLEARNDTPLWLETEAGQDAFYNDFDTVYINCTHKPIKCSGAGTIHTIRTLYAFGAKNSGDTTSSLLELQTGGGSLVVQSGFVESYGASGAVACRGTYHGLRMRDVTFDSVDLAFLFEAGTLDNKAFGCANATLSDSAPAGSGNYVEGVSAESFPAGLFLGTVPAVSRQQYFGVCDESGLVGPILAVFTFPDQSATQQHVQGLCHCPTNDLLYAVSRENKLFALNPHTFGDAFASALVQVLDISPTLGDTGPLSMCYCPANKKLYYADRANKQIVVINPTASGADSVIQTLDLTATAGAGVAPYGIAYCPLNGKIYVANDVTNNLSIINPTSNGTDTVVQTLAFGQGLFDVCYCPFNQKIYACGNGGNIYSITPTANGTDSIAQTLASGVGFSFRIAYCPLNRKLYTNNGNAATFKVINPTAGGTDTVTQTVVFTGATVQRTLCWDNASQSMLIGDITIGVASVLPSPAGNADVIANISASPGGTPIAMCMHPGVGRSYDANSTTILYERG